jgi:hypothetical protein
VNWNGLRLYGPDVSAALIAIGGLSGLTGVLRLAKLARNGAFTWSSVPGNADRGG